MIFSVFADLMWILPKNMGNFVENSTNIFLTFNHESAIIA